MLRVVMLFVGLATAATVGAQTSSGSAAGAGSTGDSRSSGAPVNQSESWPADTAFKGLPAGPVEPGTPVARVAPGLDRPLPGITNGGFQAQTGINSRGLPSGEVGQNVVDSVARLQVELARLLPVLQAINSGSPLPGSGGWNNSWTYPNGLTSQNLSANVSRDFSGNYSGNAGVNASVPPVGAAPTYTLQGTILSLTPAPAASAPMAPTLSPVGAPSGYAALPGAPGQQNLLQLQYQLEQMLPMLNALQSGGLVAPATGSANSR